VNGRGRIMARTVCHLMGHWHLLKQASLQIWRMGAAYFFGPFWHECYPSSKFYDKPSLKTINRILSLFRLAYPEIKPDLTRALGRSDLSQINRRHLTNLKQLLEWFIPKVLLVLDCLPIYLPCAVNDCICVVIG